MTIFGPGRGATIIGLIRARADEDPGAVALDDGDRNLTYRALVSAVDRAAAGLVNHGVGHGDRVAMLSENSIEYAIAQLACAKLGAIAACQNWRLSDAELAHCIELVEPVLLLHSGSQCDAVRRLAPACPASPIEQLQADGFAPDAARPEDIWLIIYTSGTTGRPKAAMISHQAEIARMCTLRLDLTLSRDDGYVAWAPMFHMGGTEHMMATLMAGGTVFVVAGFQPDRIAQVVAEHRIGWLLLVPATILPLIEALEKAGKSPRGVRAVGCMADLVPASEIAAAISSFGAPFLNSFGSTETGMGPLSGGLLGPKDGLHDLAKRVSSLSELRLADPDANPVSFGEVGEALVRGPGLFSGYWNAPDANAASFVDGWFRMGDLFRQRGDYRFEYEGRSKYLIKSGGENIYPAEIERLLLADPRIKQAVVVKQSDAVWGEVPVVVLVAEGLEDRDARALLEGRLARYKMPSRFLFVQPHLIVFNVSGKPDRAALELMVANT
jgi:acyl-CoA synthetase (AMP-forming)/AMP-acid ligase II